MYKKYVSLTLFILIISCSSQDNELEYPESTKIDFNENLHGYQINDSYRWLEDFTSDESLDWVKRQNKFTQNFIKKNKYKKNISRYLETIWGNESISIPYKVEGRTFYYFNDGLCRVCYHCSRRKTMVN